MWRAGIQGDHSGHGEKLPRFMIPNVFQKVDAMPLTKNGKIDRKALMASYEERK